MSRFKSHVATIDWFILGILGVSGGGCFCLSAEGRGGMGDSSVSSQEETSFSSSFSSSFGSSFGSTANDYPL